MTDFDDLKLFATYPHSCSYLPEQQATTLFIDPEAKLNARVFSLLSDQGFRRSGRHVYRPHCENCQACIPIRIPTSTFQASKSQRRVRNKNSDLETTIVDSIDSEEHFELYVLYLSERHGDGDMFPPTREQYQDFLSSEWGITEYIEFRKDGELIAVSVTDVLSNGLSAIYFFFDPKHSHRSLGVYNIVHLITQAKERLLPFVYLGYWIKDCQKMNYKVNYRPFQIRIDNQWVTVSDY